MIDAFENRAREKLVQGLTQVIPDLQPEDITLTIGTPDAEHLKQVHERVRGARLVAGLAISDPDEMITITLNRHGSALDGFRQALSQAAGNQLVMQRGDVYEFYGSMEKLAELRAETLGERLVASRPKNGVSRVADPVRSDDSRKPIRLDGKSVFIVGSKADSAYLAKSLRDAGAHVIYPHEDISAALSANTAQQVAREIDYLNAIDAVIVFDPMMRDVQNPLPMKDEPAVRLARELQEQGKPVMIMDALLPQELTHADQIGLEGIPYVHRLSSEPKKIIADLARMMDGKQQAMASAR